MITRKMFKLLAFAAVFAIDVSGHGMMLDPPNRSSLWRFDPSAPANYNDNQLFCGGFSVQWNENDGQCGVCGDNAKDAHPQDNENTGTYGRGTIVANYTVGQVIDTSVMLTANHLGHFEYQLCELKDDSTYESGEDCFQPLLFEDGGREFPISKDDYKIQNRVKLPDGFSCDHCVLRWHYTCGNNWGTCPDGSNQQGCGPQENFRSCADIRIA